jgi:hypothetical protein
MRTRVAVFAWIVVLGAAVLERAVLARASGEHLAYGNQEDTSDPLDPSNKGLNPRVVDAAGNVRSFPLKAAGAQLYYGTGQPMRTPKGELVRATGAVSLNYGIRLEREGQTNFLAWQTNHDAPAGSGKENATGWVVADDMTDDGAAAARAAIPRRLGSFERPTATDARGKPRTFIVNGDNVQGKAAAALNLAYIGVANHHRDKIINFFNLHDGRAGVQLLVNLPDVRGGGIAEDCLPNGTPFTAAADAKNELITRSIAVYDKQDIKHTITFIYGKAGDTWGWVVKDWLD